MAAVCFMLQFATMDRAKYDDVMKALDWKNSGAPKGLISHIAGPMKVGWAVVDGLGITSGFRQLPDNGSEEGVRSGGSQNAGDADRCF